MNNRSAQETRWGFERKTDERKRALDWADVFRQTADAMENQNPPEGIGALLWKMHLDSCRAMQVDLEAAAATGGEIDMGDPDKPGEVKFIS